MIFLKELLFNQSKKGWAINLPAFKGLQSMEINTDVTFLVGENGSGKSTLIETLAVLCNFNVFGGSNNNSRNIGADSDLSNNIRLTWNKRTNNGFFLRAESFFNYASYLDDLYNEMKEINSPEMYNVYNAYGGKSLHKQSHGQAFRSLIENRFQWPGLYLLDEPEAALSPKNQLVFLSYINEFCKKSQFIIATHSPIIMSFPNAQIYNLDSNPLTKTVLEDVEHFDLTKNFLNNPKLYLHHLFSTKMEDNDND